MTRDVPARQPPVHLDPDLPPVRLPADVWNQLCAHARESASPPHPEECCGLLLGDAEQRHQRVRRCQNVATQRHRRDPERYARDGTTAFVMNEPDYVAAEREAEGLDLAITAVYHSHVGFDTYLSEADLECILEPAFPFPDADQIVISVIEDRVQGMALFQRADREAPFVGRRVSAEPVGGESA